MPENKWACADCGHEQGPNNSCEKCGGIRVVLISVIRDLLGPDWKEAFQ